MKNFMGKAGHRSRSDGMAAPFRLWPDLAQRLQSQQGNAASGCKRKQGDKPWLNDSTVLHGQLAGRGARGEATGGEADAHHLDLARRRRGNTAQVLADQLKTVC
ncbi:hypothetical protein [Aquitalea magnusonii]|uniref:hypothetical protein n=1 Tax=Aquitalea magnusonii TaxID=332411 RepID=UPI0011AE78CA|nr:hypothetical protein [Aquitalea magnusonii]